MTESRSIFNPFDPHPPSISEWKWIELVRCYPEYKISTRHNRSNVKLCRQSSLNSYIKVYIPQKVCSDRLMDIKTYFARNNNRAKWLDGRDVSPWSYDDDSSGKKEIKTSSISTETAGAWRSVVLVKRHHHSLRRTFWLVNRAHNNSSTRARHFIDSICHVQIDLTIFEKSAL